MPCATAFRRFLSLVPWSRAPGASRRQGPGKLPRRRRMGVEPLEDRRLLSIDPISLVDPTMVGDTAGAGDRITDNHWTWVSQNGQYVAYTSDAPNLVSGQVDPPRGGDLYSNVDVFLYDRGAKTTALVSHADGLDATTANGASIAYGISADGQYVLFGSNSTNLVNGQIENNADFDFFLYNTQTRTSELVSRSTNAKTTGDGGCLEAVLSDGGRYVAFTSTAPHLVSGQSDTNGAEDAFLFDRVAQTVQLVSHVPGSTVTTGGGGSRSPSISDDGQWVAYASDAADLVAGNANGVTNVFVFDVAHGTNQLVSHNRDDSTKGADDDSGAPAISGDGQWVAYESVATDLVSGQSDNNTATDVFLYSVAGMAGNTSRLVSSTDTTLATTGNGASMSPAINSDGTYVAFTSVATDLVSSPTNDPNYDNDVFLFRRSDGVVRLVSHTAVSTTTAGSQGSRSPTISRDGQYVAFTSKAADLAFQSERNTGDDVFVFATASGAVQLASHESGSANRTGDWESSQPAISDDGNFVAFVTDATNLVADQQDSDNFSDVVLFDRVNSAASYVSLRATDALPRTGNDNSSATPGLGQSSASADGRFIVFTSYAEDLVAGQVTVWTTNVFLYDALTKSVQLVSHNYDPSTPNMTANGKSDSPTISADGRYIAYVSNADDLIPGLTSQGDNVFLFDRILGTTTLVSHAYVSVGTTAGSDASGSPAISADGRFIAFSSFATNLVDHQSDAYGTSDIFLYNASNGNISLVSADGGSGSTAVGGSVDPVISADGRFVAFTSAAAHLVAGQVDPPRSIDPNDPYDPDDDVFLFDRTSVSGAVQLVSHISGSPATAGNKASRHATLNADGQFVAFESHAGNLLNGQLGPADSSNLFLFNRIGGGVQLVSHAAGLSATGAQGWSSDPSLSADGRFVAFLSTGTNLVAAQVNVNSLSQVFLFDTSAGTSQLVSHAAGSATTTGNNPSFLPVVSGDGRFVAYSTMATDLVGGVVDQNQESRDVFRFDRLAGAAGANQLVSQSRLPGPMTGDFGSDVPSISGDGRSVVFNSGATDLAAGDYNRKADVFLFRAAGLVNHAPTLSPSGPISLGAIRDDIASGANAGAAVDALLATPGFYADAEGILPAGIAVIGADNSLGKWQYSTDGGARWVDCGALQGGSATLLAADGLGRNRIRFQPDPGHQGSAWLDFRAWDGSDGNLNGTAGVTISSAGGTTAYSLQTATVSITIDHVNHAPKAVNDPSFQTQEDQPLDVTAALGVLANDTDADGDPLAAAYVAGSGPANGTLDFRADGSFTYSPDNHYYGTDSFQYRAGDGSDSSDPATVTITISQVNRAPSVSAHAYSTVQGRQLIVSAQNGLRLGATDADGDPLTFAVVAGSGPAHGTLSINPSDGSLTYTPTTGYFGADSFRFAANDGTVSSTPATVTLTVLQYDPDPVVYAPTTGTSPNKLTLRLSGTSLQLLSGTKYLFNQPLAPLNQPLAPLNSLTIVGAGNKGDTLTVDFSYRSGGAFPAGSLLGGVIFDCSGGVAGTDALVLRGTTGNNTFTVAADHFGLDGTSFQAPGIKQLSLAGLGGMDTYAISNLPVPVALSDTGGVDKLDFSGATSPVTVTTLSTLPQRVFGNDNTLTLKGTIENLVVNQYEPDPVIYAPTASTNSLLLRMNGGNLQLYRGKSVLFSEPIAALDSLKIMGASAKSDTLTVDFNVGGAFPAGELAGGVVFDSNAGAAGTTDLLVLRGTSGNNNFSVSASDYQLDGTTFRLSGSTSGVRQVRLEGLAGMDTYAVSALLPVPLTISDTGNVDALDFSAAPAGVNINLANTKAQPIFGSGNTLTLKGTIENILGTAFPDKITGNNSANLIRGLDGADLIYGGSGNDTIYGGAGNDTIYGGSGNDLVFGEAGDNTLYGESGSNVLVGGDGNDQLAGSTGASVLIGGLGQDTLNAGSKGDILIGGKTLYDATPADLLAILAEWTSRRSPAIRVSNLTNGAGLPTSTVTGKPINLKKGDGVLDDHVVDTLYGGKGADWFLYFDDNVPVAPASTDFK